MAAILTQSLLLHTQRKKELTSTQKFIYHNRSFFQNFLKRITRSFYSSTDSSQYMRIISCHRFERFSNTSIFSQSFSINSFHVRAAHTLISSTSRLKKGRSKTDFSTTDKNHQCDKTAITAWTNNNFEPAIKASPKNAAPPIDLSGSTPTKSV